MTAATVGFGRRASARVKSWSSAEWSTMSVYDIVSISLMSAPAAKTFSPP